MELIQNVYQLVHPLGTTIKVMFLNDVADTVNIGELVTYINDINDNVGRFVGGSPFKGLTIELWNKDRKDIPLSHDGVLNIGNYAGLTWGANRLIALNSGSCASGSDLAQTLSHEVGHQLAFFMNWGDTSSYIRQEWDKRRGIYATAATATPELVAEDIRLLFGCRGAKGVERTDKFNYVQATKIQGLKDLYKIWDTVDSEMANAATKSNKVSQVSFITKDPAADFDFIQCQWKETSWWGLVSTWRAVTRVGVHEWRQLNNKYQWVLVRTF